MNKRFTTFTGSLLLAAAPAFAAEDAAPAGPVRAGWYVAPLLTYMQPDSARCGVDSGFGASAVLGHRGDFASLELWGQLVSLPHSCSYTVPDSGNPPPGGTNPDGDADDERDPFSEPPGDLKLTGAGIGLLLGPFFEDAVLARFFGIVGFGVLRRQDHPQYATDDSTIFGDAGLGYMHPLQVFGWDVSARLEARYRYDVQQPPHPENQDPAPPHSYNDIIVNLGIQIPLSAAEPTMPAAAEPVAVVATADGDGDGVDDARDQCPSTVAGIAVDDTGCAPPAAEPASPAEPTIETAKAGDKIVLHGVNFETARATLTTNAKTILDQVAEKLVARPELRIEVGGHTDARGSDDYNQDLSDRRAQSVMTYLTERGVAADRLSAVGYGEGQPVDSNDTDDGRERNRRVELKVLEPVPAADTDTTTTTSGESS
jgi:outer membrane protein OmpA-like peptidoglycan-associated protein